MTTEPTKEQVEAILVKIDHTITLLGERTEGDWKHDAWDITFRKGENTWSVSYKTGTGNRKKHFAFQEPRPTNPKLIDVFYSLLLDENALNENFDDWCENCGFSSDSTKDLNTYKACLENGRVVRKLLTSEERATLEAFYWG
jgi:CO dehydrogenase/acetyl-CoA synthase delta subunit